EDVLRLLRFFRFYAHYGAPPPDADALTACRKLAHLLPTLSGERVCGETLKLLRAADPAGIIELMREEGVLIHILPEATNIARLRALVTVEGITPDDLVTRADPIRRLAALLDGREQSALAVALRLGLSNLERERLLGLAGGPMISPDQPQAVQHTLIYRL